jgi:hypothetical protein
LKPGTGVLIALLAALLATGALAMKASAITISTVPITFPFTTLNGTDVTANTSGSTWQADGEGNPAPWHINVSSTDFTNAASKTIAVSNFEIRLLDANIVAVTGPPNPKPSSTQTSFTPLSGTELKIATANAAQAVNLYDLTPDFRLTVPAETYTGDYSATVTITIVAGP